MRRFFVHKNTKNEKKKISTLSLFSVKIKYVKNKIQIEFLNIVWVIDILIYKINFEVRNSF